jgi:hypothetical protein
MKIQNRLAGIAEGLYFLNHQHESSLLKILKPETIKGGGS